MQNWNREDSYKPVLISPKHIPKTNNSARSVLSALKSTVKVAFPTMTGILFGCQRWKSERGRGRNVQTAPWAANHFYNTNFFKIYSVQGTCKNTCWCETEWANCCQMLLDAATTHLPLVVNFYGVGTFKHLILPAAVNEDFCVNWKPAAYKLTQSVINAICKGVTCIREADKCCIDAFFQDFRDKAFNLYNTGSGRTFGETFRIKEFYKQLTTLRILQN